MAVAAILKNRQIAIYRQQFHRFRPNLARRRRSTLLSRSTVKNFKLKKSQIAAAAILDKSSAAAEMGDRGHNRHGPKRGGCCAPFAERWEPV